MLRIGLANHADLALAAHDLTHVAQSLYAGTDLHGLAPISSNPAAVEHSRGGAGLKP